MNLTYYGHACFQAETGGKKLLFDPFITANELARHIDISRIDCDYILLSHGHGDHLGDTITIAQSTGAMVVSNFEVCEWLSQKGCSRLHPMNTGGQWNFGDFSLRCTAAQHSSSLPDGSYGGNPMGFIVSSKDGSFYYSGDTALTMDMQLIPKWAKLNFAVLPVGDNFTMGYDDAAAAAGMLACKTVLGVHYDSFDLIRIDHAKAREAFAKAGCSLHLVPIGDTVNL